MRYYINRYLDSSFRKPARLQPLSHLSQESVQVRTPLSVPDIVEEGTLYLYGRVSQKLRAQREVANCKLGV
jgi:hypothetical protein